MLNNDAVTKHWISAEVSTGHPEVDYGGKQGIILYLKYES